MPYQTSLRDLAQNVQAEIDQMDIPAEIHYDLAGDYKEQQDSSRDMLLLGALIIMLV